MLFIYCTRIGLNNDFLLFSYQHCGILVLFSLNINCTNSQSIFLGCHSNVNYLEIFGEVDWSQRSWSNTGSVINFNKCRTARFSSVINTIKSPNPFQKRHKFLNNHMEIDGEVDVCFKWLQRIHFLQQLRVRYKLLLKQKYMVTAWYNITQNILNFKFILINLYIFYFIKTWRCSDIYLLLV